MVHRSGTGRKRSRRGSRPVDSDLPRLDTVSGLEGLIDRTLGGVILPPLGVGLSVRFHSVALFYLETVPADVSSAARLIQRVATLPPGQFNGALGPSRQQGTSVIALPLTVNSGAQHPRVAITLAAGVFRILHKVRDSTRFLSGTLLSKGGVLIQLVQGLFECWTRFELAWFAQATVGALSLAVHEIHGVDFHIVGGFGGPGL